jgi:aspartate beta-hydroxylase
MATPGLDEELMARLHHQLSQARSTNPTADLHRVEHFIHDMETPTITARTCHLQYPALFVEGVTASPWYSAGSLAATSHLSEHFHVIRQEAMELMKDSCRTLPAMPADLVQCGSWRHLRIVGPHAESCSVTDSLVPQTARIIRATPRLGELAFLSILAPHTHVRTHCGPWNLRLNVHLAISIPSQKECGVRVASEIRHWQEGQCLVFDDSFEHKVWNDCAQPRCVLVVNVWHPELSDLEVDIFSKIAKTIVASEGMSQ